jgi:hypothetical protein
MSGRGPIDSSNAHKNRALGNAASAIFLAKTSKKGTQARRMTTGAVDHATATHMARGGPHQ